MSFGPVTAGCLFPHLSALDAIAFFIFLLLIQLTVIDDIVQKDGF